MLIKLFLFPGVLFHELSHFLMCMLLGVKVKSFKVSLKELSGSVSHIVPKSIIKSIFISIAPALFSIILTFLLIKINFKEIIIQIIKYPLLISILHSSLPSKEDTNFHKYHSIIKKILSFPLFITFRILYILGKKSISRAVYSLAIIILIIYIT